MNPDPKARRMDRTARRAKRADSPLYAIPFRPLRNPLPPLEFASPEQIEQIHLASMHILENVGVTFLDEEALAIWERAGAKVAWKEQHVWLDRGLVLEAVGRAPAQFTWRARNPAYNLTLGGNFIVFGSHSGMAYVTDLDRGRRPGTLQDLENLVKLGHSCNVLHLPAGALLEPQDLPVAVRHLHRALLTFTLTDKPARAAAHGRVIPLDDLEMARIAFGGELPPEPVLGSVINVNSPLRFDDRMLGGLITYARFGQVVVVTPFLLAGAMSPVTMAAALAQQNAEALAGVALAQLVNPGTPVVYGGFTTNIDMKSGSPAFGTPEAAWAAIVGAQLARRYRLPYRGSGSLNTSKTPDAQAAYETLWTLWPTLLAHTNLVHHAVGWMEGGLTVSYEKLIIDVENLAMFYRFFEGFEIDEPSFALDMIAEIGSRGHHLGTPHTQERFRTAFYQPFLSDRLGYEPWAAAGGWDAARRANLIWKELLARYEPPPIDPAILDELHEFKNRRASELEHVNLYQ